MGKKLALNDFNRVGDVMVSVLALSAVDRGFEHRACLIKDYKVDVCCFLAKHSILRSKSKDWLTRNRDTMLEWSDISTQRLLFQ